MNADEVNTVVALLRSRATYLPDIEAKAAAGGLPKSVRDTISAFSNDRGGTILLGLDENAGFTTVAGFHPVRIRDSLAGVCANPIAVDFLLRCIRQRQRWAFQASTTRPPCDG